MRLLSASATTRPRTRTIGRSRTVDALIEHKPGVHAVPPMPPVEGLAGRYLEPRHRCDGRCGDRQGWPCHRVHARRCLHHDPHGRWWPRHQSRLRGLHHAARLPTATLEVERDAGVRETLHRVARAAELPADLPGRYHSPDMAANWTIATGCDGTTVQVAGPLRVAGPWEVEPIENDFIRIVTPSPLFRGWLDGRVLRDASGRITGLHIDGGRVRNILFSRERA